MFDNPFTPLFGGRPGFFFGREGILRRFDRAMSDYGSDDRALSVSYTHLDGDRERHGTSDRLVGGRASAPSVGGYLSRPSQEG